MRTIFVTTQFKKDYVKIPSFIHEDVNAAVTLLQKDPLAKPLDVKKLRIAKSSLWRLRVGKYRLIYSFDAVSITLHRIRHRKDIYRGL